MSNDEIAAALEGGAGQEYSQAGVRRALDIARQSLRNLWNGNGTKMEIGAVSKWLRREAKRAGFDLDGYSHTVDASAVAYIQKRHGNRKAEAERGQVGVNEADLARIPDIVSEPDKVVFGGKGKRGEDVVVFVKAIQMDRHSILLRRERDAAI